MEYNRHHSKFASGREFAEKSEHRTAVYSLVHEDSSTELTHKLPAEVEFRMMSKKFGVFGLGISGIATMQYLANLNADFIAYDDQPATIAKISQQHPELAKNLLDLSNDAWKKLDYLILSPGIALTFPQIHPVVKLVNNAKIICDIELYYLNNRDKYFIGITGTNGKSTTTSLVHHILNFNSLNTVIGGNIGIPILSTDTKNSKYIVIEVSSFQLDLLDKTKFNIAALLNITPDHLDRHGNMENYCKTKYSIFTNQTENDHAIINHELENKILKTADILEFSNQKKDPNILTVIDNILYFSGNSYPLPHNNSLLGEHNQQNIAAAAACCIKAGLSIEQIISALPSFVGLKHRMQYLGQHNGITFINDSKATNADSTSKALASFNNIIWIAGGVAKEGGIEPLQEYFPKIKQALLIGKAQDEFAKTISHVIPDEDKVFDRGSCEDKLYKNRGNALPWQKCDNLENAFKIACDIAQKDDVILLSPACASYDQWKNFEQRGDAFIEMFKQLS